MARENIPKEEVRREFDRQADVRGRRVGWDDVNRIIREFSGLKGTDRVLDVACGDGILSFELAKHCAYVTGVDLSDSQLALAAERSIETGAKNLSFVQGDAEHLNFPNDAFDRIFCRLGLHHFSDPGRVVDEMIRVVKKPGHIVIADLVSSDSESLREAHNKIERSRDPAHVEMLSPRQMRTLIVESGLTLEREITWETRRRFDDWMRLVGADKGTVERTRRMMLDAAKKKSTDLDIEGRGNSMEFTHHWMAISTMALA